MVDYVTVYIGSQEDQVWSLAWNISDVVINISLVYIVIGSIQMDRLEEEAKKKNAALKVE